MEPVGTGSQQPAQSLEKSLNLIDAGSVYRTVPDVPMPEVVLRPPRAEASTRELASSRATAIRMDYTLPRLPHPQVLAMGRYLTHGQRMP